jgi:hypothetical protein
METVLQDCSTEEQCSVVRFLWEKGLNAKGINKEMFPVYGGKCLLLKAVHIWVEKFSQGRSKVADDAQPVAEVAETTVKKTSMMWVSTHWQSDGTGSPRPIISVFKTGATTFSFK